MRKRTFVSKQAFRQRVAAVATDLQPLVDGLWLAYDRTTGCHWTLEAAAVHPAGHHHWETLRPGTGLATVSNGHGEPVFQVELSDLLTWEEAGELLVVRDMSLRGGEIVLHRLDALSAPALSAAKLSQLLASGSIDHWVQTGPDRYVEIPPCLLATRDAHVDARLTDIESTLKSRLALQGPAEGTPRVFSQLVHELNSLAHAPGVRSLVWIACLRERIARQLQLVAV